MMLIRLERENKPSPIILSKDTQMEGLFENSKLYGVSHLPGNVCWEYTAYMNLHNVVRLQMQN